MSVLRASCDSTEERKGIKEGRSSESGDSSPRNLLSLSTDLPRSTCEPALRPPPR